MSIETLCTEIGEATAGRSDGWALVGGAAVSARTDLGPADGEPEGGGDIAVALSDDDQAAEVIHTLVERGHRVETSVDGGDGRGLPVTRVVMSDGEVADLHFASSGVERDVVVAAEPLEVRPGTIAPVAQVGHLIVMRLMARDGAARPDDDDLRALAAAADENDRSMAYRAAALMAVKRGPRGRDLPAAVEQALADTRTA